jgi:hypothetical protein
LESNAYHTQFLILKITIGINNPEEPEQKEPEKATSHDDSQPPAMMVSPLSPMAFPAWQQGVYGYPPGVSYGNA